MFGTPPVRALFYEFSNEPELFSVDLQWMIGSDILVTPVTTPNVSTVDGEYSFITLHHFSFLPFSTQAYSLVVDLKPGATGILTKP